MIPPHEAIHNYNYDVLKPGQGSSQKPKRLKHRPKSGMAKESISKLKKIYGQPGEIIVPMDDISEGSPNESMISMQTGYTGVSNFAVTRKMRGIQSIYQNRVRTGKARKKQGKARFRTLIGRFTDDPAILARDQSEERIRQAALNYDI